MSGECVVGSGVCGRDHLTVYGVLWKFIHGLYHRRWSESANVRRLSVICLSRKMLQEECGCEC